MKSKFEEMDDDQARRWLLCWLPVLLLALIVLAPIVLILNIWQAIEQRQKIRRLPLKAIERKLLDYAAMREGLRPGGQSWKWVMRHAEPYALEYERRTTRH
jgi:hypothetical protein